MLAFRIEYPAHCGGDGVHLSDGADSQDAGCRAEEGEKLCQPFPVRSQTSFDVVERSAQCLAVFVQHTVFYGQETFRIFGCHTHAGSNFHPEQCARSAGADCGGNADDVTGSNGGRQCGGQCCETGDLSFAAFLVVNHVLQRLTQFAELQGSGSHGEKQTGSDNEYQHGDAPHITVNGAQHCCELFHECNLLFYRFSFKFPSEIKP